MARPAQRPRQEPAGSWRVVLADGPFLDERLLGEWRALGFNAILIAAPGSRDALNGAWLDPDRMPDGGSTAATIGKWVEACRAQKLALWLDLDLTRASLRGPYAKALPEAYVQSGEQSARDPRLPGEARDVALLAGARMTDAAMTDWRDRLAAWLDAGVDGLRFQRPERVAADDWRQLFTALREKRPTVVLQAQGAGLTPGQLDRLHGAGFDLVHGSLPWWNYRTDWLAEEHARLSALAPIAYLPAVPPHAGGATPDTGDARWRRALWTAAYAGDAWIYPQSATAPATLLKEVNQWASEPHSRAPLRLAVGVDGRATLLSRGLDLLAINPRDDAPALPDLDLLTGIVSPGRIGRVGTSQKSWREEAVAPGDCVRLRLDPLPPVGTPVPGAPRATSDAPRIVIETVTPSVENGRYAAKCVVHDAVAVEADIFMDGHDVLAAEVLWRAVDDAQWQRVPLVAGTNDRWRAVFRPERIGAHEFVVQAWRDGWGTYTHELSAKHRAGVPVALEVIEGLALLRAAATRPEAAEYPVLKATLTRFAAMPAQPRDAMAQSDQWLDAAGIDALLSAELSEAMAAVQTRAFPASAGPWPLWVDRAAARHANWYELFPRSQGSEPGQHGTLRDVIARLPAVRAMGFDVLYFPPIHPIGTRNRKGRNNSLRAGPDDVGSPYAIGSEAGGHDAIEPALGTLEDFLALVKAAAAHDLELALDFAIQCSPDHPWLRDHPDWFSWRADGSMRHAENPPKKYEDIVNVNFYGGARQARRMALWRALRDVVLFWVEQGVRTFRVDNPHTKPLPFWEWLIAEVHAQAPDAIFLSEAFTRPKMMRRLAKVGFTQSYTYFTWRNHRTELDAYFDELSNTPAAQYFRPHFFVNTPDINPYFLQTSGRPGFLIRAALACTGSGLWGMYSGFEICESAPLPGKEEYLDSEKYELRWRDWDAPGHIRREITRLNEIRRANAALQSHTGYVSLPCDNGQVLAFCRHTPRRGNVVLVAINLDPSQAQQASIALPLDLFGLPEHGSLAAHDQIEDARQRWTGPRVTLRLDPTQPYGIWRLSAQD
ncbi:alpha-amlyase [Bordetella genomosp. 5]|uniref:alpha-1,4-glucan--maltose-1-phosphate maltosyltransferase n=1 Tax=Bordetella genomosp. 5 TaxID=1395608 RepID=UPI000B9E87E1|nr:alpha-1,4-glucan--maltose-1-phosphate maltosyltransferase [Bordetella genomosp. 5]OZI43593.1 alpha-amlyase [Bordetella genomosp. 5]